MEEILALQAQLAQVQEVKTNLISERIVMEIIQKLIKQNQIKIIYTKDGQEYITPDKLVSQLKDLVLEHEKININQIADLLNINFNDDKLDFYINELLKDYKDILKINEQLITENYLNSIAVEVNEELDNKGIINIQELSSHYNINQSFFSNIISQKLKENLIRNAFIQQNFIISSHYKISQSVKIRGALRGVLKPILLNQLGKITGISDVTLIIQIIESLIENKEIEGKIVNNQFFPLKFIKNQEKIIKVFLQQNNYIEYALLENQLFINKPRDYLEKVDLDLVYLREVVFMRSGLKYIEEQIMELLQNEGFIDVVSCQLLPSCMKMEDIVNLLNNQMNLASLILIQQSFIFYKPFINSLMQLLSKQINQSVLSQSIKQNKAQILDQKTIVSIIKENKFISQDMLNDDEFLQSINFILQPLIQQEHQKLLNEKLESNKSISTNFVFELQKNIEQDLLAVQIYEKTFTSLSKIEKFKEILNSLEVNAKQVCSYIFENIIILLLKKYQKDLNESIIKEKFRDEIKQNKITYLLEKNRFLTVNNYESIFSQNLDINFLEILIEQLPKETILSLQNIYFELNQFNIVQFVQKFKENQQNLLLKSVLDKKSEKNYITIYKNNTKYFFNQLKNENIQIQQELIIYLIIILCEQNFLFYFNKEMQSQNFQQLLQIYMHYYNDDESTKKLDKLVEIDQSTELLLSQQDENKYNNIVQILKKKAKM